jgi:hypothetical protein
MLAGHSNNADEREFRGIGSMSGVIGSIATSSPESLIAQKRDLSFSWYCRLPADASMGAAVRIGDAMFGLATVESTLPACEGTAAATLLNMLTVGVCNVLIDSVLR